MNRIASTLRRSLGAGFVVASGVLLAPAISLAAVPDPVNSIVPACLTICPGGDLPFTVSVRDINNTPVAGSLVRIDLSTCADAVIGLCTDESPGCRPRAKRHEDGNSRRHRNP